VYELDTRRTLNFRGRGERAQLSVIVDAWGNRVTFEYQGGVLSRVTDTAGRQLILRHDADGHVTRLEVWAAEALTDAEVAVGTKPKAPSLLQWMDYTYDDGCLTAVIDAAGHADRCTYDAGRRMVSYTLKNGVTFFYRYDADGRCFHTYGDGGLHTAELSWGDGEVFLTGTHEARRFEGTDDGYTTLEETLDGHHQLRREYDDDRLLLSESNAAERPLRLRMTSAAISRALPIQRATRRRSRWWKTGWWCGLMPMVTPRSIGTKGIGRCHRWSCRRERRTGWRMTRAVG
jgi:YD repeat-containing protein